MTQTDDATGLEASAYPLIVYIHVPKTAGSTVKTILNLCTPRGHQSAQGVVGDRASFLDLARNSDWIGGHLERENFGSSLTWLDRPLEYFSSVREPVAQLVSHLNYSFERYNRANYYNLLDQHEHQLDADVMSVDFTNPEAVMNLLLRYAGRYLNAQSPYLLGPDFSVISDDEIARRLATYKYVASEYDLPELYRAFGFAQLPERADEIRENAAKRYVDAQIFDSPQLREFLAHYHKHDTRLYAAVRAFPWSAAGRRPFRPAFLALPGAFTPENFDEQAYLYSNPDVAAALQCGHFQSGRDHFDQWGYGENRPNRRWVLPPAPVSERKSIGAEFSTSAVLDRLHRLHEERRRIAAELHLPQRAPTERLTTSAIANL